LNESLSVESVEEEAEADTRYRGWRPDAVREKFTFEWSNHTRSW